MKKNQLPTRFLLFTLSFFSLLPLALHATDVIYGNCHYREIEGRYAGFRKTEAATTFETDDRITLVYCLRIPRDSVSGTALLVSKVNDDVTLNVRVKKCDTDEVLLEHSVTAAGTRGQNLRLPIIPRMKFPQDTWYRIELQAPEGYQRIQRLTELDFERDGHNPVIDAHLRGFPTPATHLWFGHSTAANAPQDESYEWCYQEVLMPKQWATINTYLMTLGITGGYMGIQKAGKTVQNENGQYTDTIPSTWWNQALFSIWDNGDTDVTPNLATYLRAGALAWGNDVAINHFGNEGTGCQAMISHAKWEPGQWVQFLTCARPEERSITLRASDGTDSIIRYPCSLLSTWYKNLDDPEWHYMATIRHSGESHYYSTWYSFIENWADSGGELFRRAYYRNNYQRSVGSGKWYFINKVDLFSQTDYQNFIKNGEITARHRRMDYGHGLASDVPRAFYMQTGGYGQPKDSANVLPLVDDHSCVESINLDSLLATLGKAYQDDSKASMKTLISTHGSKRLMAELVEELISKTNRFEGYTYEAMAPVRELAQTEYSVTDMKKVLLKMAEDNQFLRYGNTVKASHICSFRAYMLTTGTDILAVRDHRVVCIPQADADVTDPFNHWIVLRHDDASYYCLYNLGAGSFLAISNGIVLDNVPHKLNLTFSNGKAVFREGGGKFLGFGANNNPVVSSSTKAVRLELLDNYNLTPSTSLCYALLEQTTDDGIATGIESLSDSPLMEQWAETEGWESASLSDDIAAVYYYDLQGRRIGYALPAGQTVVAHIVLRNGASIVRKIKVGK
ncbi:MAG: DUF3472 domain-containing protein [Bacteroidaceae bacterium]|nr:DUF3472 domain-containing protein [Bacteroidaceae bacterium]